MVIADDHSGPAEASHPGMVLSPMIPKGQPPCPSWGPRYDWRPELAPEGPVNVLISGSDRKVYVYRNGIEIGFSKSMSKSEMPLAEGIFTILEGYADHENPWIPGRPAPRWMPVWTDVPGDLDQTTDRLGTQDSALNRVHMPLAFATPGVRRPRARARP